MAKHYIIMSSSYTDGTRIALDITDEKMMHGDIISGIVRQIKEKSDEDVPLSSHLVETEDSSWDSVIKYDPFFEDVEVLKSPSEFAKKISKDRMLSGLDVAVYVLSKMKCTHLQLEKLVYFAYADYLCNHSEPLFVDKIYAFAYGPVIASVNKVYKKSGYGYLKTRKYPVDSKNVYTNVPETSARSRILFAKDGAEKLLCIDKTLGRYGRFDAWELVALTHRDGSPWSMTPKDTSYQIISDETIRAYHHVEEA